MEKEIKTLYLLEPPKKFEVISLGSKEEYILSDPQASTTSLSYLKFSSNEVENESERQNDTLSGSSIRSQRRPNRVLERHLQSVFYQALDSKRKMVNTHIRTAVAASFNTDPNKNILHSSISLSTHSKNNAEEIKIAETEVPQVRDDSKQPAFNENFCDKKVSSRNVRIKNNIIDINSFSRISKENPSTGTEITEIDTSANENCLQVHSFGRISKEDPLTGTKIIEIDTSADESCLPIHRVENIRNFFCHTCSKSFKCKTNLRKHVSQVHDDKKQFVCKDCQIGFKCATGLKYHIFSHHTSSSCKSKCTVCYRYFSDLKCHMERAHLKVKTKVPERCDICQKIYITKEQMLTHRLRKHEIHKKTFICNECSAVFSCRNALISHIKVHHMAPEFKCSICSEHFPLKVKLTAHLLQVHGQGNEKTYICDMCGKKCKTSKVFQNHLLIHSDKQFVCEDCGKTFTTSTNLAQHSRTHSDFRPFICDLCEKSFKIRHHLRQHMAVHGLATTPNYRKRSRKNKTRFYQEESCSKVEMEVFTRTPCWTMFDSGVLKT